MRSSCLRAPSAWRDHIFFVGLLQISMGKLGPLEEQLHRSASPPDECMQACTDTPLKSSLTCNGIHGEFHGRTHWVLSCNYVRKAYGQAQASALHQGPCLRGMSIPGTRTDCWANATPFPPLLYDSSPQQVVPAPHIEKTNFHLNSTACLLTSKLNVHENGKMDPAPSRWTYRTDGRTF